MNTSDPLDDYILISDEDLERQGWIRILIGGALLVCLWSFISITGEFLQTAPRGDFPIMPALVAIMICLLYLSLVRIDSGRWSPVHPRIADGFRRLLRQRRVFLLIIAIDLIAGFIVIYPQLTGWKTFTHGWLNAAIILGGIIAFNMIALFQFGQLLPD